MDIDQLLKMAKGEVKKQPYEIICPKCEYMEKPDIYAPYGWCRKENIFYNIEALKDCPRNKWKAS